MSDCYYCGTVKPGCPLWDGIRPQCGKARDEINALRARAEAQKAALAFAVGAINDAIYTEDGLDGDTGQRVLHIIAEALDRGSFDVATYGEVPALCRMSDLENALARAEAAERDAERYRWLRDVSVHDSYDAVCERGELRMGADLDAAIDAARATA